MEFLRGLQDDSVLKYDSGRAILVADGQPGTPERGDPGSTRPSLTGLGARRHIRVEPRPPLHPPRPRRNDRRCPWANSSIPVTELLEADVFVEDGDRLTFRHDLIREAVRAGMPIPVRRGLDRQAADVLIARGALPTEVALQLAESAEPGDDVAIETVLKATQQLALSDPAGAASLAERGLELAPERHPLRGALVVAARPLPLCRGARGGGQTLRRRRAPQHLPAVEEARVRLSVATMFDISPEVRAETARAGLALPGLEHGPDRVAVGLVAPQPHRGRADRRGPRHPAQGARGRLRQF